MIIYVNGDSFTDGSGLGDHVVFENFPGNMIDRSLPTRWGTTRSKILSSHPELRTLSKIENRKRVWATQLKNYINAEIINEAVGGSGIFSILTRTIHDVTNLVRNDKIPDLVLIGLTTCTRIPIINTNPNPNNSDDSAWIHTALPTWNSQIDSRYRKYIDATWESHTDEELLLFFLYQCLHIKHYIKSITNKDPIFLNTTYMMDEYKKLVESSNIILLKEVWELLEFSKVSDQISIYELSKDLPFLPCGHVTELAHAKYAKYVYENILSSRFG